MKKEFLKTPSSDSKMNNSKVYARLISLPSKYKWKGGVLSFTIAVSIVVSVVLMMMITLAYYTQHERGIYRIGTRLIHNLSSATAWCMSQGDKISMGGEKTWDLYGRGIDSVTVYRFNWGLFEAYLASAYHGIHIQHTGFLKGNLPSPEGLSSIYLEDNRGGLALAGDTHIKGTVYLPIAGPRTTYINRVGYTREKMIYGNVKKSKDKIPALEDASIDEMVSNVDGLSTKSIESIEGNLEVSFIQDTLNIFKTGDYTVKDTLSGFLLIKSSGTLTFDSLSYCNDIWVVADQIEFKNGFHGQGQFFARDTIIVNENVVLDYPSVLYVENETKPATIVVKEKAEINGFIIIDGDRNNHRDRLITLENESTVNGMIYANGFISAFGEIDGHVCTRGFVVNTFSGVYENHLFNASFNHTLDSAYLMPGFWFASHHKGVVQWLF